MIVLFNKLLVYKGPVMIFITKNIRNFKNYYKQLKYILRKKIVFKNKNKGRKINLC